MAISATEAESSKPFILNIVFNATGVSKFDATSLGYFIYSQLDNRNQTNQHVLRFNGVGVDYGWRGGIFGHGMDAQCLEVVSQIKILMKLHPKLVLNMYGFSRGGTTALMVAKALSSVSKEVLQINLALLDPMPGNSGLANMLDPFNITLTNKTNDLTGCNPLNRVLLMYGTDMPSLIPFHLAQYPNIEGVETHIEIVPGMHMDLQTIYRTEFVKNPFAMPEESSEYLCVRAEINSYLPLYRVLQFFKESGAKFQWPIYLDQPGPAGKINLVGDTNDVLSELYRFVMEFLGNPKYKSRKIHDGASVNQMFIASDSNGVFLNRQHQQNATHPYAAPLQYDWVDDRHWLTIIKLYQKDFPLLLPLIFWATCAWVICMVLALILTPPLIPLVITSSLMTLSMAVVGYDIVFPVCDKLINSVCYPYQSEVKRVVDSGRCQV